MTRFHTKKSPDKTLHKLKEVLDTLKYSFTVNSPRQVKRFTYYESRNINFLLEKCIKYQGAKKFNFPACPLFQQAEARIN